MKCPNCRCVVPNNILNCSYCGYEFSSGSAKTQTVYESYYNRVYNDDYYINNYEHNDFGNAYSKYYCYAFENNRYNMEYYVIFEVAILSIIAILLIGLLALII